MTTIPETRSPCSPPCPVHTALQLVSECLVSEEREAVSVTQEEGKWESGSPHLRHLYIGQTTFKNIYNSTFIF